MAVNYNIKGTLYPSFKIGKGGATIYQGTSAPVNGTGNSGDLYLFINGSASSIYQNQNGTWSAGAGGGVSSIVAGSGLTGGTITNTGTLSVLTDGSTILNPGTLSVGTIQTANIASSAITYSKIQNVSSGVLLGNSGTAAQAPNEITLGTHLSLGTNGTLNVTGVGTGSVTSVNAGNGLTGGPITGSGTLSIQIYNPYINGFGVPLSVSSNGLTIAQGSGIYFDPSTSNGITVGLATNSGGTNTSGLQYGYETRSDLGVGGLNAIGLNLANLASGGTLGSTNLMAISQSGTTYNTTLGSLATYFAGAAVAGTGAITATSGTVSLVTDSEFTQTSGTLTLGTSGVTAGTYQGLVVNSKGLVTSASNQNYGTGSLTQIIAGSGLTGGTITNTGTLALGTVGTAGSYNNVTTDAYGRVTAGSNVSYLTNNQNITISGDASGAGSTAIVLTLGTTGVTAGTGYNNFTVNAKGLITAAGSTNYLTTNQSITITGDASGAGSTAITLTLGTTGVTAGTYGDATHIPTIVVNAKGLITSISSQSVTYGTGSVTSIATGTGLTGGPITSSGTIAMGTSGVTAGTYGSGTQFPQVVVDGLGRVTFATTIALGSIASQSASNVNITGGTITGLPTPVNASDAANKAYVDNATTGLSAKSSSRVATTGTNIAATYNNGTSGVGATLTLTGTGNIVVDGVTLNVGDRVLVKDQTSVYQNGIYSVTVAGASGTSAVLTRTTDFNSSSTISEGAYTVIEEGTINKGTLWLETGQGPFTIGTTSVISFTELTVAPQTIAITGDATGTGAGTINVTLGSVNANVGTFGNTTNIPTVTVNSKGLVTAISNTAITYGTGSVTQIIAGSQLTGGTINGTGTISLGTTAVTPGTYQGLVVNAYGQITSASNQSYLTTNQNITVTGDVTGAGSTAITLTLGSVVAAGTYNQVTVGTKGLVTSGTSIAYLTTNQNITITGDATGAGSTAIALTLGTSGVTAGTGYNTFTVNAKGLITSASTVPVGTGSVTSVAVAGSNGIGVSGSPITNAGTITLTLGTITPTAINTSGTITASNFSGSHSGTSSGTNTGDQTITLTGDLTGSGTGSFATTLATVNSNVGTFGNTTNIPTITVNAKGLVTGISNTSITYGTGSVTSVSGSNTGGISITGSPITNSGTLGIGLLLGAGVLLDTNGSLKTNWINSGTNISGSTYTISSTQAGGYFVNAYGGNVAVTLPSASSMANGALAFFAPSAGTMTLTTTGTQPGGAQQTIYGYGKAAGGGTSFAVPPQNNVVIQSDGANWHMIFADIGATLTVGSNLSLTNGTLSYTGSTGTGSVTQIIAGTGLTGGTIVGTGTIAIGTTGVTAGTYQGLVVNALGQITSATNQNYGTGNVVGTSTTVTNSIPVFGNTTGNLLNDTAITIDSNQTMIVPKGSNTVRSGNYLAWGTTNNGSLNTLFLDNVSQQITLADATTIRFTATVVGRATGTTNAGSNMIATYKGAISRNTGAASTAMIGDVESDIVLNPNTLPWSVLFSADTTNGALKIQVTGQASTSIGWGVQVSTVEVNG